MCHKHWVVVNLSSGLIDQGAFQSQKSAEDYAKESCSKKGETMMVYELVSEFKLPDPVPVKLIARLASEHVHNQESA